MDTGSGHARFGTSPLTPPQRFESLHNRRQQGPPLPIRLTEALNPGSKTFPHLPLSGLEFLLKVS